MVFGGIGVAVVTRLPPSQGARTSHMGICGSQCQHMQEMRLVPLLHPDCDGLWSCCTVLTQYEGELVMSVPPPQSWMVFMYVIRS